MGYALRRWLRDLLGPDIKGLKRAIALEIADDARWDDEGNYLPDSGRCSRVSLADLVRWTGAKDERTVREELRRLALAGWEFRKAIGVGKDGRTLYAVPGRSMEFRVPEGPTGVASEGPTVVGPDAPEGPTVVAEEPTVVAQGPTVVASEATVVGPPSLVTFSRSSPDAPAPVAPRVPAARSERETKAQKVIRGTGLLDQADEEAFISWATRKFSIKHAGWWTSCADDIPDHIQTWLAQRTQAAAPKPSGERCTTCSTIAPVALTDRDKPYCAACVATCTNCHSTQPEDQLAHGECHPCRTARSSAA